MGNYIYCVDGAVSQGVWPGITRAVSGRLVNNNRPSDRRVLCVIIYAVRKKTATLYFCYNFVKSSSTLIIFGAHVLQ